MTFSEAAAAPLRWAGRLPVTLLYCAVLAVVAVAQRGMSDVRNAQVVTGASTNLHNLAGGRLETLVESAFVTQEDPNRLWVWLPGLACLLALGELLWRSRGLAGAFTLGHIGGTLIVAVGLVVTLRLGWVQGSVVDDDDVGVSYGSMAVIGGLVGALPRVLRPGWAAFWVSVATVAWWFDQDFTSAGHIVALVLGLVLGTWLGRKQGLGGKYGPVPWTPLTLGLLAGACAFGVGVLVDGFGLQTMTALVVGASAAALTQATTGGFEVKA